jgi:putative ATPase
LDDFVGQEHIIGRGKLLRRAIEADKIGSIIFYGPPGCGKTTLAEIIAKITNSRFVGISAVTSNVSELKRIVSEASNRRETSGKRTILFIDEIHRFNKSQQDVLLPHVENGVVSLIGTTTYNPFFYINAPLVSRSKVFQLKPLANEDLRQILRRALDDSENGLKKLNIQLDEDALEHWLEISEGDARKALNALEIASLTTSPDSKGIRHIDLKIAEESIQKKAVVYDRNGDQHYDTISAFIKSLRGSNPDAGLYWLAKMLYAGEDPRFIARRLVIAASEDVGNADPQALTLANAAYQAVESVGMPEAQIPLAQAVTYIATAPKSNASCIGLNRAMKDVEEQKTQQVPKPLRDTHYSGARQLGHGEGYKYAHDFPDHIVEQEYMPEKRTYYRPSNQGFEAQIARRMKYWKSKLNSRKKNENEYSGSHRKHQR